MKNMTIGFRKHAHYYDGVLCRTVIARKPCGAAIRIQNVAIFQVFLKNGLHEGERIATPVCALARNDSVL